MNDDARLRDIAGRLGANAAARLDVERTTAAVLARLRAAPPGRRPVTVPIWLRIAAAIALVLGAGIAVRAAMPEREQRVAHFVVDDLSDLSAEQLRAVLASLDETLDLDGAGQPDAGGEGFGQLDVQQLRAVLRSLEG